MTNEQKHKRLQRIAVRISKRKTAHVAACEFSAEDDTPTLHIDLWRGFDLHHLPQEINALEITSEGFWDGGRCYSLQIPD
jgi:hypothetical protein